MASDGDLMEGVASEAASLAGHLKLGKLIYLYDDNRISLAGATDLTFTEDRAERFRAYGWHTQSSSATGTTSRPWTPRCRTRAPRRGRPSLILVRTHIGYGSPHKQDTFEAHGSPLGVEEVRLTKQNLGWPVEPDFLVPPEALAHFREALERGKAAQAEWEASLRSLRRKLTPTWQRNSSSVVAGELPPGWAGRHCPRSLPTPKAWLPGSRRARRCARLPKTSRS